ncbi:DUF3080 family protein [Ferrimonas gelatinilytica]|uniref:DUF3080 domain-containing protein n=1 Tax=Ferrimonas gelatinilytica TaxID=1255257 RepID=A0ABP9RX81_9GAMM
MNRQQPRKPYHAISPEGPATAGLDTPLMSAAATLCVILLVITLTGCQRAPEAALDDYNERLARVLDVEEVPIPSAKIVPPKRPPRSDYALSGSVLTVDLVSPLALKPCGVLPLIAARNAPMGKLATPSQHFLYQRELLHHLYRCPADTLTQEGNVLKESLLNQRRPKLDAWFARSLLLGDELWFAIGAAAPSWQFGDVEHSEQALIALNRLREASEDLGQALAPGELERLLHRLHGSASIAGLHRTMLTTIGQLGGTLSLLQQAQTLPCDDPAVPILSNILTQIYGKRVQPLLSRIQQVDRTLSPPLRQLLHPWPKHPYFDFYLSEQEGSLRGHFYVRIRQHTEAWQALLQRCQRQPQARGPNG